MTHQEHLDKWINKYQERRDPSNLNQCFDLAVGYCIDVFSLPETVFQGLLYAYQIFDKPTDLSSKSFDFIKNTLYSVPKQGDIIVWGKTYNGTAGHVAVVNKATTDNFEAFSQNDPTGSKCILKTYNYNHISGWLRRVGVGATTELQACLTAHKKAVDDYTALDKEYTQKKTEWTATEENLKKEKDQAIKDKEVIIANLQSELFQCNQRATSTEKNYKEYHEKAKDLQEKVDTLERKVNMLTNSLEEANEALSTGREDCQKLGEVEVELAKSQKALKSETKKYKDTLELLKQLNQKIEKDYIPLVKQPILRAIQQVITDIDKRLELNKTNKDS